MYKYNMWSFELLNLLLLFRDSINPFDYLEYEEIVDIFHEAFEETIDKYIYELMIKHNLSLHEARYIVVKQLISK